MQDLSKFKGSSENSFSKPSTNIIDFIDVTMNAVWDNVVQLRSGQILIGDGRVVESIFEKFKQSNSNKLQGITIKALGIKTLMASNEIDERRSKNRGSHNNRSSNRKWRKKTYR